MGLLSDRWDALNYSEDTLNRDKEDFRMFMHREVGEKYPWLTAELFTIEGELGWGPGFRDFDDTFFFMPPEMSSARSRMKNFVHTLDSVKPDLTIANAVSEVERNAPTTRYARMLHKYVKYGEHEDKNRLVRNTYYMITDHYFPETYVVGAARIYKSIWDMQKSFKLAIAGLLRLYYSPLTKISAGLETAKRRIRLSPMFPNARSPLSLQKPSLVDSLPLPVMTTQFV